MVLRDGHQYVAIAPLITVALLLGATFGFIELVAVLWRFLRVEGPRIVRALAEGEPLEPRFAAAEWEARERDSDGGGDG